MSVATAGQRPILGGGARHDALLYRGVDELVAEVGAFAGDGLEAGDHVVVVLPGDHLAAVRSALPAGDGRVTLLDMFEVGRNPGRLTSTWHRFALDARNAGVALRGVGEPVWPGRSLAELAECHLHEALLGAVLAGTDSWVLCPYDVDQLGEELAASVRTTHSHVRRADAPAEEEQQFEGRSGRAPAGHARERLTAAPASATHIPIVGPRLKDLRHAVRTFALGAGLPAWRAGDLVLAASELAANTVRHGGGVGSLSLWIDRGTEGDAVVVEVRDGGRLVDPLAGRRHPTIDQLGGRGLWLVHQVCDLVQVRSSATGTVVRAAIQLRAATGLGG